MYSSYFYLKIIDINNLQSGDLMFFSKFFSKTSKISNQKFTVLLKQHPNILLFDLRSPSEFHSSHIPTARNYPIVQIDSYSGEKKHTIYLIDSGTNNLTSQAAATLKNKGYKVVIIQEGYMNWDGPLISDK